MHLDLILFILIPSIGFVLSLFFQNYHEKSISNLAIGSGILQVLVAILLLVDWVLAGQKAILQHLVTLYENPSFEFRIEFYYDKLSMSYSLVSSIVFLIANIYGKYYMHRESGFKRYFVQLFLFNIGINLVIVSGNFETFFIGWEIIGICSFLLIAFYRERFLPVKNSLKVLSYFRLGDVALVCAFWEMHHLFHANIHFEELRIGKILHDGSIVNHPDLTLFISGMILLAAAVKSAQFPFSAWLPRAMEGPTVSSAIFYGSLSIHVGLFLLIRTYPLWNELMVMKVFVISLGIITALISTSIARVQPTVKTQIAYSSITQLGLMFVEIGLGLEWLAIVHFMVNAFLRTYQLLVSPSAMSYLSHRQFFHYDPNAKPTFFKLPWNLSNTLYVLSVKEWNMDFLWHEWVWSPLKKIGVYLNFIRSTRFMAVVVLIFSYGLIQFFLQENLAF